MIHNPELRRNIWLDFSLHRLILTPITLGLMTYLCYLASPNMGATFAFYAACFFMYLWGPRLSADTVMDEVNHNTWDFQRQSAISPWTMTIGKWVGSTLFTWYGAVIALSFYVMIHIYANLPRSHLSTEVPVLIIGALLTQALSLLLSLQILPLVRNETSNRTFSYFFLAVLTGVIITGHCLSAVSSHATVTWHHMIFNQSQFYTLSMLGFLAWAIIGLYRSFSKELQYHNIPWVWLVFNLYCILHFSGFSSLFDNKPTAYFKNPDLNIIISATPYYFAFTISIILCYFALFTDSLSSLRYRKLFMRYSENNPIEALQLIPWWVVSFLLAIVVGLLSAVMPQAFTDRLKEYSPSVFILTSLLFLLRDILLVNFFFLSKNPRRAQGSAIIYLALLWIGFPMLLEAMHLGYLVPLLLPTWGKNTALCFISVAAQIGFIGILCWNKWQMLWKDLDTPPLRSAQL
ncbi:MAG: hypothetical protein AB7I18_08055 [Candidatus Berkiella sp.]